MSVGRIEGLAGAKIGRMRHEQAKTLIVFVFVCVNAVREPVKRRASGTIMS